MLTRVVRTFRAEHANSVTLRTLARNVDCVSIPRRGDLLALPDLDSALPVDRATIVGTLPDRPPTPPAPRVIVTLGVESGDRYERALALGWRTT
jgi:hypothetical protein